MDYKRTRFIFEPHFAIRQVLLVDSKAEKTARVVRVQTSQTSMRIRQVRAGRELDIAGTVPKVAVIRGWPHLTTTVFVKYVYREAREGNVLLSIRVACIPNGYLQDRYNPTATDTIWKAGPNAPKRGESFRTRLGLDLLKEKKNWRVQDIPIEPEAAFVWDD